MPHGTTYRPGDDALFGHDRTSRIVAVHPVVDRSGEQAIVRVFRREARERPVVETQAPFFPFLFLSDMELMVGFDRRRFRFQELKGGLFYRHLLAFKSWNAYWGAVRHIERRAGSNLGASAPHYLVRSPAQQYLMQTGRTSFKDMSFEELHRMQIDIEVVTDAEFPVAERERDAIVLVALSDNSGWREIVGEPGWPERRILETAIERIRERDPDVLEGHNVYGFDFPYLMARCERLDVPFTVGRDGTEPRTFRATVRFAERSLDFTALDIAGRHVVDTYFQVMTYDVAKRDLPGYGLKDAARYFGLSPTDRTYIRGSEIAATWRSDPDRVMRYAEDDVIETERLARHLSESTFYLARMVPMPYGQVARTGPAAKIEGLFVREYLRQKHSLPAPELGAQTAGGYADVFFTGVAGPIVYADVESLYPSIMLEYRVQPERDRLRLFPFLLKRLTDLRLETKAESRDAEATELKSALDARQGAYKIVINSFYGYLGFSLATFNDYSEADRVTATGRQLLRLMIEQIRELKGAVIEVDTDGVLFVPPAGIDGEAAEREFVRRVAEALPEGIRIGFEGRFVRMLSYKIKNYALRSHDGRMTFKGSSLISRAMEPFGRRFVRRAIRLLLDEDVSGLHALYLETREMIVEHRWRSAADFARAETLKVTVERYLKDVESGRRARSAAYELAIDRASGSGPAARKGDRVSYYIQGSNISSPAFEAARPADEWNAEDPDENTAYYLRRLDEFAAKFRPFFEPADFRSVFSTEDLFGFEPSEIAVRTLSRPGA